MTCRAASIGATRIVSAIVALANPHGLFEARRESRRYIAPSDEQSGKERRSGIKNMMSG